MSESIHILFNALCLVPGVNGGNETYFRELLKALSEIDHEDRFELLVNRKMAETLPPLPANFKVRPVSLPGNGHKLPRTLYEQAVLPFVALFSRAEVVLFPGNTISLLMPALSIPSVVTIHDAVAYHYRVHSIHGRSGMQSRALKWLVGSAARLSSAIITVSEFSRTEIIREMAVPESKIHVVPLGCPELGPAPVDLDELKRRYALKKPYVLVVGRTHKHKNVGPFVRAFAEARKQGNLPHRLVVVGPPGSGEPDLEDAVKECDASEFVHRTGYVDNRDLAGLYHEADLVAMPSKYEGFGLPVLEAMSLGAPTLISNAGSLPEVGGDAACYFDPDSVQSMTQGILKMLTDASYRQTLSEAGPLQAARYSWRRNAVETLNVCRMVVTAVRSKSKRSVGFPVAHDQSKGK